MDIANHIGTGRDSLENSIEEQPNEESPAENTRIKGNLNFVIEP